MVSVFLEQEKKCQNVGVSSLTFQVGVQLCSELNTLVLKGEAVDLCSYLKNIVKTVLNNKFKDSNDNDIQQLDLKLSNK